MALERKPVRWLGGEIKSPPFSEAARHAAGRFLDRLQNREVLGLPQSRPMPSIGPGCHELRVPDDQVSWRIFYCLAPEAVLVLEVEKKKTQSTPAATIERCRRRLQAYRAR